MNKSQKGAAQLVIPRGNAAKVFEGVEESFHLLASGPEREWHGWWRWEGRRYPVRLVAAKLTLAAAQGARRRQRRTAQKAGRTLTAPTRAVAGGLLLSTTLDTGTWAAADVLEVSRARWQVELVCKNMQQWLRRKQMRSPHRPSVEATVRALLIAWAWHASTPTLLRTLLSATARPEQAVGSSWLLSGLGLDTLRQQVQGRGAAARGQACLPRLRRCLCSHPRRRVQQVTLIARLRLDARLYAFPELGPPGKRGPKQKKGPRVPPLTSRVDEATQQGQEVEAPWYGGGRKRLRVLTGVALWHTPGEQPLAIRWVLVVGPEGHVPPGAFFSTALSLAPAEIVEWFILRWHVEVTFEEGRRHLGWETQRQWSAQAIAQTTPALFGLFSLVCLMAYQLTADAVGRRLHPWR